MRETIARFRELLVARMVVLADEVRLAEALYKERHGDYSYVTLENAALFERQIGSIERLRRLFEKMDIEDFKSIQEFKDFALCSLQQVYEERAILRSGIRMIIECVRGM